MRILGNLNANDIADAYFEGITDYTSLATDVIRIGSTPAVLLLDDDVEVSTDVIIPSTLKLKWVNGARLIQNGGTITFVGNPFFDGQEMGTVGLFRDFGVNDITFLESPARVSSEIVSVGLDSITYRLWLLTTWFAACRVEFHCFPHKITDTDAAAGNVELNDYHSVYFQPGGFFNTYTGGGILGAAAFVLGSYAKFHADPSAIIYSTTALNSPQIVQTKDECINSVIENCTFVEGGGGSDGATTTAIISPGSVNCHIRNCKFTTGGYQAGIASSNGLTPEYCTLDGNYHGAFMTQNIFLTGGRHCKIINNTMNFKDLTNGNAYASFIDIEPNSSDDVVEDLEIANNTIDFRGATLSGGGAQYAIGIVVQGVDTAGAKRVSINNNWLLNDDNARMQYGIQVNGVVGLDIFDNKMLGCGYPIGVSTSQGVRVYNNVEYSRGHGSQYYFAACARGYIYNNISHHNGNVVVTEYEAVHPASATGTSLLTLLHQITEPSDGRVYDSYAGLNISYNGTVHTVVSVDTSVNPQTLTVSGVLPALTFSDFDAAVINPATDTFNVTGHGLAAGALVHFYSFGTPPTSSPSLHNGHWWVIFVDVNNFKLAASYDDYIANIPIDITAIGSGTSRVEPDFLTLFSSNVYRENKFDSITLSEFGSSIVTSDISDIERKGTVTVDPTSIAANTVSSQTFTLTGAVVGDSILLNPPAAGLTAGLLVLQSFVSATDTITIVFYNTTGAPIDEGSAVWAYKLSR